MEEALAFWDEQVAAALAASGPTIVRIVGDMACVKTTFATVDQMLTFERMVGAILTRSPTVAIYQYVREFDGPSLLEAMKAHPDVSDLGFAKSSASAPGPPRLSPTNSSTPESPRRRT